MASSSARTAQKTLARQKKRAEQSQYYRDRNLLVKDANIWTQGRFIKGSILVEDGRIKRTARKIDAAGIQTIEASGFYALPGLVDAHVHLRDLQLAYKEDFASGTSAAAAGGFTTLLDMPNTIPPTDSPSRLIEKQEHALRKVRVNVGFHAAATSEKKTIDALAKTGAFSLKLYMPKPIAPFNTCDDTEIRKMMIAVQKTGIPITVHAEDIKSSADIEQVDSFQQLAKERPAMLETRAVERILLVQSKTRCKVHFCHLTLASSLQTIHARSRRTTSEVTPHHLLLSSTTLKKVGWKAWMVPPLRSKLNQRALLATTRAGYCDTVASDHAPHTIREKTWQPRNSPPGIPGLETTLPLMLTLVNKGFLNFSLLIRLLTENPARIFGLRSKAKLQPGYDGDIALVDKKKRSRIDSSKFLSKAKYSPFEGFPTRGGIVSTIVGGTLVYDDGDLVGREGCGSVLRSKFSD
jgi:dihydroorotase